MAYLLNAKVDSSNGGGSGYNIMDLYNRFDYGYGAGIKLHPIMGLQVGARVNISLGNLYKDFSNPTPGSMPSFIPKVDVKNNVFQIFAGWRFGRNQKNDK